MKYVIDSFIIFEPDHNILYNRNDHSSYVVLQIQSCRLLSCFIENKGVVLSREFLLKNVWTANGYSASEGNLNNNISMLRKSFLSLNCTSPIISTLPKLGFQLNEGFISYPEENIDSVEVSTQSADCKEILHQPPQDKNTESLEGKENNELIKSITIKLLKLSFLAFFILFYIFIYRVIKQEEITTPINFTYESCNFYDISVGPDSFKESSESNIVKLMSDNGISCKNEPKDIFFSIHDTWSINAKITLLTVCELSKGGVHTYCHNIRNLKRK